MTSLVGGNMRFTLTASAVLHAAIALLLLWRITTPTLNVPIGIDLLYVEAPQAAVPGPAKPATRALKPEVAIPKTAPAPVQAAATSTVEQEAGGATQAGSRDGVEVSALDRYKYELRSFLETRKIYPESAKRLHQTGTVVVQFVITRDGDFRDVAVQKPAGADSLNRAALEMVRQAQRFKAFPTEVSANELQLSLPIEYIL